MSELGDLLELMHGARNRYRTLRLTMREWQHSGRHLRVFEEQARRRPRGGGLVMYSAGEAEADSPPTEEQVTVVRLWIGGEARVREERDVVEPPGERSVSVRDGDWWWTYSPSMGAMTNEGDPNYGLGIGEAELLDPSELLARLDLEVIGTGERAGRPVIVAHGVPRKLRYEPDEPVGEQELEVDREVGVLLRLAHTFEGEEYLVSEVTEIAFDEDFPDAIFTFVPPEGEGLRRAGVGTHTEISLEEAAGLVPFELWAPSRVPPGFRLHVGLHPAHARDTEPGTAVLSYLPDDGRHHLSLCERRLAGWAPVVPGLETIERHGEELRVRVPGEDEPWRQTTVLAQRGETLIEITSDLPLETLLELVDSLVPAPPEPPELVPPD